MPRRCRPLSVTGLAVFAPIAVLVLSTLPSVAQTAVADSGVDLLQPSLQGNPANPPTFMPGNATPANQAPPPGKFTAPSRIGLTPTYGSPTGFGAGDTGFDSQNRTKSQRTARVPAQGSAIAPESTFDPVPPPPPQVSSQPPVLAPPPAPVVYPAKAAARPGATLPPPPDQLPISNPPAEVHPTSAANRPGAILPIPAAIYFAASASTPPPGTPQPNTLPLGAVPQHTLPIAAGDPYEALGIKAGSFLILPALELSAGYDNNPQHVAGGSGSDYFVAAPEVHVRSDWSRHSLTADVTGSYTDYTNGSFTPSLSRPFLNAKSDGRIDVTRDTQILTEGRVIVSTDNPGSPNIQAGLAKLPIDTTVGGTLGVAQQFSRFNFSLKGTVDRSMYQNSQLTDGESVSNDFRNFDQYAGILRFGYEVDPGFKPFVEISEDTRIHDTAVDSFGEDRNSNGSSAKLGGDFDVFGSLTGEIAVGYMERDYHDPTLPNISGVTLDGSLIWQATALTTAKFTAASAVNESILQDVSGAFSRDFSIEVDHAFRSWLIGTLQAGYGNDDYVGMARDDNRYFVSGGITYKMNRDIQLKGVVRHDWLTSTQAGNAYEATSALLTLRLQR
ncbi:MAG: outer membrane beta-barrel protein [Xanthobacteraceae bacterium]